MNYLNEKYKNILKNAKPKGLNRKNFDISDLFIDDFFIKISLRDLLKFYVDFEGLLKNKPSFIIENIKTEHLENLLKIIVNDNIILNKRIMFEKITPDKKILILNFFKIENIKDFHKILNNSNRRCKKCGNIKSIFFKNIAFCDCEVIGSCNICGKVCISRKQLLEHYIKKHKINWFIAHKPKKPEIYCLFCKEKVDSSITRWNVINPKTCKNKNCPDYKNREKERLNNFLNAVKSRENFDNSNYVKAAHKREEYFKNTILENGETLKSNICKKSGSKISKKIKERILNGEFTPEVTNSWCNSLINYKNKKFRSSWEIAFYLIDENLEYEKTRIKYFNTKLNKFRTYIVDFTDFENKILYEIKPDSKIDDITNQEKFKAAELFSKENSFSFQVISEKFLLKNLDIIKEKYYKNIDLFCDESKRKMLRLIKQLERLKNENNIN